MIFWDLCMCKVGGLNCVIWENGFKTENVALCLSTNLSTIWTDSRKIFYMKFVPF